jgi:hypothetical protein
MRAFVCDKINETLMTTPVICKLYTKWDSFIESSTANYIIQYRVSTWND